LSYCISCRVTWEVEHDVPESSSWVSIYLSGLKVSRVSKSHTLYDTVETSGTLRTRDLSRVTCEAAVLGLGAWHHKYPATRLAQGRNTYPILRLPFQVAGILRAFLPSRKWR
jgi:hypothetical protein